MINVPARRADREYILKLTPPELPHLVANEYFFLEAARRSGLSAVEADLVHDSTGPAGLLSPGSTAPKRVTSCDVMRGGRLSGL